MFERYSGLPSLIILYMLLCFLGSLLLLKTERHYEHMCFNIFQSVSHNMFILFIRFYVCFNKKTFGKVRFYDSDNAYNTPDYGITLPRENIIINSYR